MKHSFYFGIWSQEGQGPPSSFRRAPQLVQNAIGLFERPALTDLPVDGTESNRTGFVAADALPFVLVNGVSGPSSSSKRSSKSPVELETGCLDAAAVVGSASS